MEILTNKELWRSSRKWLLTQDIIVYMITFQDIIHNLSSVCWLMRETQVFLRKQVFPSHIYIPIIFSLFYLTLIFYPSPSTRASPFQLMWGRLYRVNYDPIWIHRVKWRSDVEPSKPFGLTWRLFQTWIRCVILISLALVFFVTLQA